MQKTSSRAASKAPLFCVYAATSTIVMDQSDPTIPMRVFITLQHPFDTLGDNNHRVEKEVKVSETFKVNFKIKCF